MWNKKKKRPGKTIRVHDKNGWREIPANDGPTGAIVRQMRPGELNNASHTIDVRPNATNHVEMKTSAVDRAKGFLIATLPLFSGLALGFLLIAVTVFDVPLFSLAAACIFWLTFVGAWLLAYVYTLAVSAEGIAMFEAKSKWSVIKREQKERWNYYKRLED